MGDKVKWTRSGTVYPQPVPVVERYVAARVDVNGSTHLGLMVEGVCFQVCNTARNPILLPVADKEVECEECLNIMKRRQLTINMAVRFEEMR